MTEYTGKRARTRGQLLAAGQELLLGAVRRGLEYALGPGPVTHRAGLSRQTWYRYWRADNSGYLDELMRVALDTAGLLLGPRLAELTHRVEQEPDGPTAARTVARAHFLLAVSRRVAMPQFACAALAIEDRCLEHEDGIRPTAAPEILRAYGRRLDARLATAYGSALRAWDREPIPPADLDTIAVRLHALADGFVLRSVADPDLAAAERFATATVEVVQAWTRPSNSPS